MMNKPKEKNEKVLEIPFKYKLPQSNCAYIIDRKCQEILALLTSNFFALDEDKEKRAIDLALACEQFVYGDIR